MDSMASRLKIFIFLIINSTIFIIPPTLGAEISSKIDLEDEITAPPATLSSSVLKAYVDLNQGSGLASKPSGITSKPSRGSGESDKKRTNDNERYDNDDDYISIEELFKKRRQQMQQNPIAVPFVSSTQGFYGEPDVKPTIINNIHVTINANDSSPGVKGCKNGVCDVIVSSKPDAEGNVITNVHLSVVTKFNKSPIQVADIPVIDGTAGIRTPQFDQLPPFHFVDQNIRYSGGPFFDNNIPQIPIHRQEVDSWYHRPSVIYERPRPVWNYGQNSDRGFRDSHTSQGAIRRDWIDNRNRGIVDDKIEPPLSKTKPSQEQDG